MQLFESVLRVRLPSELARQLKTISTREARTVSDVVRQAVLHQLREMGCPYRPGNDALGNLDRAA